MVARKELFERYEVAKALSHLLSFDGNHIVVHPIFHHFVALRSNGLRYFAFVVWENEVQPAAVYVEMRAEVLAPHCHALGVPARKTFAPLARPVHDMFGLRLFPKREIHLVFLFACSGKLAALVDNIVEVPAREYAVAVLFVVRFDVEIYASVAFISHAVAENLTNELLLLDYVPRSVRLYARVLDIQCMHGCMEAVGVILCHLHRLQLLEAGLLLYLVLTLVGVVLQVANVGYVPYVSHLVA